MELGSAHQEAKSSGDRSLSNKAVFGKPLPAPGDNVLYLVKNRKTSELDREGQACRV